MASPTREIVLQGAGPMCGHPNTSSAYMEELSGLVATLYLVHRICSHHDIQQGQMTINCDNKGAIKNVFQKTYQGISPFILSEIDLITIAQALLATTPITTKAAWVAGHSQTKNSSIQESLNILGNKLAGEYDQHPDPSFRPRHMILPLANYRIRLLYENLAITAKLYRTLRSTLHSESNPNSEKNT